MLFLKLALVLAAAYAVAAVFLGPRRAWALWKRVGRQIGDAIGGVLLTLLYFTLVVPFALLAQRRDPLGRSRAPGQLWSRHAPTARDVESARRQTMHVE